MQKRQPVLIGTIAIETSELLSHYFNMQMAFLMMFLTQNNMNEKQKLLPMQENQDT